MGKELERALTELAEWKLAASAEAAERRRAQAEVAQLKKKIDVLEHGLRYVMNMPSQSIWMDSRDDAASIMITAARMALDGKKLEDDPEE